MQTDHKIDMNSLATQIREDCSPDDQNNSSDYCINNAIDAKELRVISLAMVLLIGEAVIDVAYPVGNQYQQ